eukprot:GEMP01043938.1.p1 GENE.GEMP01043938.1~~GEMP01043938.1.p1  ORF type:complete len:278 (+),score=61.61 GEMP01043938.1:199-1032(+)
MGELAPIPPTANWKTQESRYTKHQRRKERKKIDEQEQKSNRIIKGLEDTIMVEKRMLGMILGKRKSNLLEIERRHDVQVTIEESTTSNEATITIVGQSIDDVQHAKDELDYRSAEIDVGSEEARAWILREWKTTLDIAKSTSTNIHFDEPETNILAVRGQRRDVADCVLGIHTHLDYFPVFQQMQIAEEELHKNMRSFCTEHQFPYTPQPLLRDSRHEKYNGDPKASIKSVPHGENDELINGAIEEKNEHQEPTPTKGRRRDRRKKDAWTSRVPVSE